MSNIIEFPSSTIRRTLAKADQPEDTAKAALRAILAQPVEIVLADAEGNANVAAADLATAALECMTAEARLIFLQGMMTMETQHAC